MLVRVDVRDARADLADRLGDRSRSADDLALTAAVTSILEAVRRRGDDGAVACLGGLFQTPTPVITDDF